MKKRYQLLIMFVVFGCVEPVNFNFKGQREHLVVQATFTNKPGPQHIRLSRSKSFDYEYREYVENARVYITSQESEHYDFAYHKSGNYYAENNVRAVPGHTYTLHIEAEGEKYQSNPTTLSTAGATPAIDSVHYKYAERSAIVKGKKEPVLLAGYEVYVDYTDPGDVSNFYRWSYDRQYEVDAQPEAHMRYDCVGCPLPAPKNCCSQCWVEEKEELTLVANDALTNGKKVLNQYVMFIPFQQYLHIRYKTRIYQHTISEQAYTFYDALQKQATSTGTMFDPPPTELKGNIFNIDDPEEQVIGLFEASSVSVRQEILVGEEIPHQLPDFIFPEDCRVIPGATTIKPANW